MWSRDRSPRRLALLLLLVGSALASTPARAELPELLAARGIARYQSGELAAAVALLRRSLELAPESSSAGHHLGLALIGLGQLSEGRRALAAAARLAPDEVPLLVDLGQAYLLEGNPAWAVRVLGRALELAPRSARGRYLHGLALLRLGEPASAAESLRQVHGSEVDAGEAALQLSLAYYLDRRYEESRLVLGPAFAGADRSAARRLLRASLAAEGRPSALLSVELSVGAVVDGNPLYEHETTAPPAAGPSLSAALVLRPWMTSRHSLWGELSGARSFYFAAGSEAPGTSVADASPSELRAAAFYAYRTAGSSGDSTYEISGGYSFDLTFLDGAPPLADAHHIFLEQHTAQLLLQRLRRGRSHSQLRYNLIRSQFADLARSTWGNEIGFEQGLILLGERLRLLGWATLRYESAESPDYNQMVPGVGVGGSYLGPLGLVLGLRFGYEYRDHVDSHGSVRWAEQRIDNNLGFTAEIGRALPWNLRLRAVYQRLQNISSVQTYHYSRDLFSLGVSWSSP